MAKSPLPVVCLVIVQVKVLLSVYAHFVVLGLIIMNNKSAQLLWLQRDQWYRRYNIHKDSIKFWTFTVIFTFKSTIYFLHKALQLMMMYHPIKFGRKKISSSTYMVETVIPDQMSPHCDPELEDSKPIFLHNTVAHDVASSYQVWLQKVQQLRRYHPDEHSLKFLTCSVTLTLTTTEQSHLFKDNPPYEDIPSNQV